jgi:hypothetical protein
VPPDIGLEILEVLIFKDSKDKRGKLIFEELK